MSALQRFTARYAALVERYHKTLDLVSDVGLRDLPRHIDDALAYARLIQGEVGEAPVLVDVGSGAGLPGMIISAALPKAKVYLVERRRRRTAFLELARASLGLTNTEVFGGDVLDLADVCADVITGQAVADLATLAQLTRHLHRDPCWIVSRRGDAQVEDLGAILRAVGLEAGAEASERGRMAEAGAQSPTAAAKLVEAHLEGRGSLVAVRLPGGSACLPSA